MTEPSLKKMMKAMGIDYPAGWEHPLFGYDKAELEAIEEQEFCRQRAEGLAQIVTLGENIQREWSW